MNKEIHISASRGNAEQGWLTSMHTFSFAGYHDPERMHFGLLRVLNDDIVQPGKGFGMHPHDNMEIVTIPISGALEHKDNMGSGSVIRSHDIQIMSAGTGVYHSEFNHSRTEPVNFLQIWVYPKQKNIEPRYDQKTYHPESMHNRFQVVVSPKEDASVLWINQDAWFSMGHFDAGRHIHYAWHKSGNGLYIFVIEGKVKVGGETLGMRDGMGVWDTDQLSFEMSTASNLLIMEVPMN